MVEIRDNISALPGALEAAANGSFGNVGEALVANARYYVPVDTGRLRDSIGWAASEGVIRVGTSVPYAVFVELGVSGRPGAHYLRNAVALHADQYISLLCTALDTLMKGGENHVILEKEAEESEG